MCTLTYIPKNNGFILTSNRDEQLARPLAIPPQAVVLRNGVTATFARDPQANGTWLATADNGFTVCLLNGGFAAHTPVPPYRQSRGLVPLHFLEDYNDVPSFFYHYNFENIEPFTLLIFYKNKAKNENTVDEIRWDGRQKHHKNLNFRYPHIWSSCTLYTKETVAQREGWFELFLEKMKAKAVAINNEKESGNLLQLSVQCQTITAEEMLGFHTFAGGENSQNSLLMYRKGQSRTVAITSILVENTCIQVLYYDIIQQKKQQLSFEISKI